MEGLLRVSDYQRRRIMRHMKAARCTREHLDLHETLVSCIIPCMNRLALQPPHHRPCPPSAITFLPGWLRILSIYNAGISVAFEAWQLVTTSFWHKAVWQESLLHALC